jgi:hypothetical protein
LSFLNQDLLKEKPLSSLSTEVSYQVLRKKPAYFQKTGTAQQADADYRQYPPQNQAQNTHLPRKLAEYVVPL